MLSPSKPRDYGWRRQPGFRSRIAGVPCSVHFRVRFAKLDNGACRGSMILRPAGLATPRDRVVAQATKYRRGKAEKTAVARVCALPLVSGLRNPDFEP